MWPLHHDSHEAYTCDIPRPLKLKLRDTCNAEYDETCEALDRVIAQAVGAEQPPKRSPDVAIIDRADDLALTVEARSLLFSGVTGVTTKTQFTSEELAALPPLGQSLLSEGAEATFRSAHSRAFGA